MKKLRIRLDDISIESFPTSGEEVKGGTVRGHGGSICSCQDGYTCDLAVGTCNYDSCDWLCSTHRCTD